MAVGSFLMDEDPMRFEWNDIGIQWKGQPSLLNYTQIYDGVIL